MTTLVAGGLHIDWTEPQNAERKTFLNTHWREIGECSGQPLKFDILEPDDSIYNTEAACRAAVKARDLEDNAVSLSFLTYLLGAFYADKRDVIGDNVSIDFAGEFGFEKSRSATLFAPERIMRGTMMEFRFARRLGVNRFPTVVVNDKSGYAYMTVGFQDYSPLQPLIESRLTDAVPDRSVAKKKGAHLVWPQAPVIAPDSPPVARHP